MSSIQFTDTVTHLPAEWANDVDALVYDVFAAAQTKTEALLALGVRGMALQNPDAVNIIGGNINGVNLGTLNAVPFAVIDVLTLNNDAAADDQAVRLGHMKAYVGNEISDQLALFQTSLGNMAWQNSNNVDIIGGTLDNVSIGGISPANGRFINLKMTSSPSQGDDVITLGWLQSAYGPIFSAIKSMAFQEHTAVDIEGGAIDGTPIGQATPAAGTFTNLKTSVAAVANDDVANKLYVDNTVAVLSGTLGTMAYQSHGAVNILGGNIQNTVIGSAFPNTGRFTHLQVDNNVAALLLRTSNAIPAASEAKISFQEGLTERGLLTLVGSANASYDASLQGTLYLKANSALVLQGYSAVVVLTDASGLHVKHGTSVALPLSATSYTPSLTLGNTTGTAKRGSIRLYGSATEFSTLQQNGTNLYVDSTSIILNGNVTGQVLLNGNTANGAEKTQALNGLYANQLRSSTAYFGDIDSANTGLLSNGVTIKRANASGATENSVLRLANAKQPGSTFLQDTVAVDFCAGTNSSVGNVLAQLRVPTEGGNPSFNIRVVNPDTSDLEHIAAFYKQGMVLDKNGIAKGWHSFFKSDTGVTGAVVLDFGEHTVFYQNLAGATTFSFSNVPNLPGVMQRFELYLYQGGAGGHTVTWPSGMYWATQVPNFAGAAVGRMDVVELVTFNSGTTWVASWTRGRQVPTGGVVGQVLTRTAGTGDPYAWQAGGG